MRKIKGGKIKMKSRAYLTRQDLENKLEKLRQEYGENFELQEIFENEPVSGFDREMYLDCYNKLINIKLVINMYKEKFAVLSPYLKELESQIESKINMVSKQILEDMEFCDDTGVLEDKFGGKG